MDGIAGAGATVDTASGADSDPVATEGRTVTGDSLPDVVRAGSGVGGSWSQDMATSSRSTARKKGGCAKALSNGYPA